MTRSVKQIFVVGNSRSGTTMMGRILGRHPEVFTFQELHFFEYLWSPKSSPVSLDVRQAKVLLGRLFTIQRDGYFRQQSPHSYVEEVDHVVQSLSGPITPSAVFSTFLSYEADRHGCQIACDQTPRNVFYLQYILNAYSKAKVVNMVRDPRDVLLSQKNKWRRNRLGARNRPKMEMLRSWANYHPITISMLWNSAIRAGDRLVEHPQVFQLRFEDLLGAPEAYVRELCAFLDLEFNSSMLQVPRVGSSYVSDRPGQLGIDPNIAGRWQKDTSSAVDLAVCQRITRDNMARHGYVKGDIRPNPFKLFWVGITWPVKTGLALLLNLGKARNIFQAIRKRLQS